MKQTAALYKRKQPLFTLLISLFLLGGCNFLEVQPVGKTTIPTFFSDMNGARAGLAGSYSAMYDFYCSEYYKYPDVAGNMLYMNGTATPQKLLNQYNFSSNPQQEAEPVGFIWKKCFVALSNINNILEYLPSLEQKFPKNANELRVIKGQALFLRALCHFDLVRCYALPYCYTKDASHLGIPVLTKTPGPDEHPSRKSIKEVYAQILSDLTESDLQLSAQDFTDVYHVSEYAVHGLLSRVYLYMGDWDNAIAYASKVIDARKLTYGATNYMNMYVNLEPGEEAIFRLNGTLKSTSLNSFYSTTEASFLPADTLISLYAPNDIRLQLLKNSTGEKRCIKYLITADISEENKHYDPFVFRVSEAYLNRAEAYLNQGSLDLATSDVKVIMARGLQVSPESITVNYNSKEELMGIIDKERTKELCFEGHQFFDIARRGQSLVREIKTNASIRTITFPDHRYSLPIPQVEMDVNDNMIQNDGY